MAEFDLRNFDGIAFDFDGTLARSNEIHIESRIAAYAETAAELGDARYAEVPMDLHMNAHLISRGAHSEEINAWLLAELGIIEDAGEFDHPAVVQVVAKIKANYQTRICHGLDEQPGAVQFVRSTSVHKPGRLAIGSTASSQEVMPFLTRHGLVKYFPDNQLVLRNDPRVGELKPAPDVYEVVAEELRISQPDRLLVVEDSQPGVAAGKRMGATAVAITTTRTAEALRSVEAEVMPDEIVPDFAALRVLVGLGKLNR